MPTTAPTPTLADVRAAAGERRSAEVEEIVTVVTWLEQHVVDPRTSADVATAGFGDGELLLAGDGAPAVSEAAVVELVTTLGRSDSAGRVFVGKCLELKYRLPQLWQRVLDLEVEPWRAFKVAESSMVLPLEGAAHVDAALAPFAHSLSWAQLERTVTAALVEFDPERAERIAGRDPRRFDVHTPTPDGYVHVEGLLDLTDARDIDAAVTATAEQLADLGCEEPLDVRRSLALGEIGRAQLALDLDTTDRSQRRARDPPLRLRGRHRRRGPGAGRPRRHLVHRRERHREAGHRPQPGRRELRLHAVRLRRRAGPARLAAVRVPVLHPTRPHRPRPPHPLARRIDEQHATSRRCVGPTTA